MARYIIGDKGVELTDRMAGRWNRGEFSRRDCAKLRRQGIDPSVLDNVTAEKVEFAKPRARGKWYWSWKKICEVYHLEPNRETRMVLYWSAQRIGAESGSVSDWTVHVSRVPDVITSFRQNSPIEFAMARRRTRGNKIRRSIRRTWEEMGRPPVTPDVWSVVRAAAAT